MPYTTGTATDQNNLLASLRTWLTGLTSPWTSLDYSAGATPADPSTLYLMGPGAGSGKRTYVNIRTYYDASLPTWGWEIRGATGYDGGATFETQQNTSPSVFLNLNASSQDYWLFANDRRFVVVSAIDASKYCSAYCGMFLPYATPVEYPQPLYIAGMYSAKAVASLDNSANRFMVDPGANSSYFLRRSPATWRTISNSVSHSGSSVFWAGTETTLMWPARGMRGYASSGAPQVNDWGLGGFEALRPNAAGERMLWQANIIDATASPGNLVGALDGVFSVPGFGLTSTQAITVGARSFRVFQNLNRSGARDFMAIEEVA
jgi:hypothetical protein